MDRASMAMFLVGVACAAMQGVVHAQDVGKHGADYTYAPGSPTYWRNMHSTRPGSFVFQRDPNVWVYTREVAERVGLLSVSHWSQMNDVQRGAAFSALYNTVDHIDGGALPGDLGTTASALGLIGAIQSGNKGAMVVSGISLANAADEGFASKEIAAANDEFWGAQA